MCKLFTVKDVIDKHEYFLNTRRLDGDKLYAVSSYFFENYVTPDMVRYIYPSDDIYKKTLKGLDIPKEDREKCFKLFIFRGVTLPLCSEDSSQQDYTVYKGKRFFGGHFNLDISDILYQVSFELDRELQEWCHKDEENSLLDKTEN